MCSLGSIEEARRVFDKYDKNGDGKISSQELQEALDSIGLKATTTEETEQIISEIDKDGDGHIDFEEFLEFFRTGGSPDGGDNQTLMDAFNYYDLDRSGLISASELHSVLRKLGEKCSLSDCRRMISSVDKDGDGNVNFEEFKEMMTKSSS
ncbi:probable calcium-binding protein CML23 [Punica granatum]|uniref:EF-hand domain-containing protein n=2 Tax=Punica granatum TaxID=22663 RepID=A0A218XJ59_PUNGR|nr:probable calcium-binding protein CML23 [Punica granatum]OWM84993.1 hypothetical protein CDL15_Pgr027780 [Punica granatum]PKI68401.1 hypothetical protein CRG98_011198 [Punica granatum]